MIISALQKASYPGGLRLVLVILVVFFHATRYVPFGEFAVNVFFILSGYWIYRMYETTYQIKTNAYFIFLKSRILRILPLYFLCTAFIYLLIIFFPSFFENPLSTYTTFEQFFATFTLLPYNNLDEKLLPPVWSLAIEMQFYIIAPLLIIIIKKFDSVWFLMIAIIISIISSQSEIPAINLSLSTYLIYFSIGMVIWHKKLNVSKSSLNWNMIFITIFIALNYLVPELREGLFERDLYIGKFAYFSLFSGILPFFFIPVICHILNKKSDENDRILGDISYTAYVIHWIPFTVYNYYFASNSLNSRIFGFLLYLLFLSLSTWVLYFLVEKRLEKYRKSINS